MFVESARVMLRQMVFSVFSLRFLRHKELASEIEIDARVIFRSGATAAITAAVLAFGMPQVHAQHACDALGERGWHTVATVETVEQIDSAPRQEGASGAWYVDRTTTRLPFCNYYNSVGNYSLRSYSLSPETQKERIPICRQDVQGNSVAVAPYTGQCPPG